MAARFPTGTCYFYWGGTPAQKNIGASSSKPTWATRFLVPMLQHCTAHNRAQMRMILASSLKIYVAANTNALLLQPIWQPYCVLTIPGQSITLAFYTRLLIQRKTINHVNRTGAGKKEKKLLRS